MRIPSSRINASDNFENDEEENVSKLSVAKALLIFLAGVLVASGTMALTLWIYKDEVINLVEQENQPSAVIEESKYLKSNPSRLFVFIDSVNNETEKVERVISYDISKRNGEEDPSHLFKVLYSVPSVLGSQYLVNPQASSDGSTIFFCKRSSDGKDSEIWSMGVDGDTPQMIVKNAGYCDFSVRRATTSLTEQELIYVNDKGHLCFYKSDGTSEELNFTEKFKIVDDHFTVNSPVFQDDNFFYIGNDGKIYCVDFDHTESKSKIIVFSEKVYAKETKLRISPNGTVLIIVEPSRTIEIISIIPDISFRKEFADLTDIFVSKEDDSLFLVNLENGRCTITRIDLKHLMNHFTNKESLLDIFEINNLHGMDFVPI